ncbi:hypothetical protein J7L67_04950, partial [bacterium]|nr:hypothetical protein [bacterium]
MVKFIYTVTTLFFILHGSCSAKTSDSIDIGKWFASGVELYKQGNFKQSAVKFKKIIKSGTRSGSLYFNLGNCYFKMGKLA